MPITPTNPAAFPDDTNVGMELRDYFAAAALQGWLAMHADSNSNVPEPVLAARRAYEYADAMLAVRKA